MCSKQFLVNRYISINYKIAQYCVYINMQTKIRNNSYTVYIQFTSSKPRSFSSARHKRDSVVFILVAFSRNIRRQASKPPSQNYYNHEHIYLQFLPMLTHIYNCLKNHAMHTEPMNEKIETPHQIAWYFDKQRL